MKAIILLSGGLDSSVILALALEQQKQCIALTFDYGQRHRRELAQANKIAAHFNVEQRLIKIDPGVFTKTSLVGAGEIPKNRDLKTITSTGIPSTYVPARNTLFLAYAAGQAELYNADEIHAGPNLLDYNPYPDCRPEFYAAFQALISLATKQAIEGTPPKLVTPLILWDKRRIVQEAIRLNVPIHLTHSCYHPELDGLPCKECDACIIREDAMTFNGILV